MLFPAQGEQKGQKINGVQRDHIVLELKEHAEAERNEKQGGGDDGPAGLKAREPKQTQGELRVGNKRRIGPDEPGGKEGLLGEPLSEVRGPDAEVAPSGDPALLIVNLAQELPEPELGEEEAQKEETGLFPIISHGAIS